MPALPYVAGGFFMKLRMPTSYYIMGYIISFCMTTGIRFSYRLLRFYINRQDNSRSETGRDRVMIIGAGRAGQTLIKEMLSSSRMNVQVCCIIDDNPNKKGRVLEGIPIVGNRRSGLSGFGSVPSFNCSGNVQVLSCIITLAHQSVKVKSLA